MHFRNILRFAQHVGDVLPAEETRPAVSVADGLGQQFWDLNGIYIVQGLVFLVCVSRSGWKIKIVINFN